MFLKAFEEGSIPDAETISLNYLPDRVLWSTMAKNKSPDVASRKTVNYNTATEEQNNHGTSS